MPKETIAIVLFLGFALGIFWGCLSLILWSRNETIPGVIIAPLWLTAQIASGLSINPYLVAASACTLIGLVPSAAFLLVARARGA